MPCRRFVPVALVALLSGCSHSRTEVAAATPPAAVVTVPMPMPRPPIGAAANLTIPARLGDGGYATPNRAVSPAGAIWHLRAALNVAALVCRDPGGTLPADYSHMLGVHRTALAEAHRTLAREYGSEAAFDTAMTRLYNYFSQPPAQAGFCATAASVLTQANAVPPASLAAFAAEALPHLDRPFVDFYAAYDRYRSDLAAWRAGTAAPRLAYDDAVFVASDQVSGRAVSGVAAR